ncbi:arabinose-proton symporter [Escherichia coli]|nr:arabinose-proton symporter [Escherichia coli]
MALFNGWLSFRLGRKYSLMAGAILFVLGSIGSAFATSVEMLIAARVVLGIAVGIASYTAPLYLSEMASENVRGKMISMYQLMVTLGIVLAFLSDTAFSYSGNWRAMLGVLALPAVLLIILVVFLPNSPRWLAEKGRHIEAEEVLRMLRDTSEKAREELNEIRESLKLKQGGWALFKINRNVRRAVFSRYVVAGDAAVYRYEHHHVLRAAYLQNGGLYDHRTTDDCDSGRRADLYVRHLYCGVYGR